MTDQPLEELRVAFLLHRLNSSSYAPSGYDILKIATNGSAKYSDETISVLLLWEKPEICSSFVGTASTLSGRSGCKSVLGTVGLKSSVDYTIVNGKIVVENGHLVNIDEEKFISEARKSVTNYLSRS